MKFYYDLHIHSCLSLCADDDMTPSNIVNMCALKGLDIIAISDHNSDLNAMAAAVIADKKNILLVPAIELTTAEDIHILCLFRNFEGSSALSGLINKRQLKIINKPQVFGHQYIMDQNDEIVGEWENLLSLSSGIRLEEVPGIVKGFGGVAVPAHVDRQYNSLIGILGAFDYSLGFKYVESRKETVQGLKFITNSDAHTLGLINERVNSIELKEKTANALIDCLLGL